MNHEQTLSSPLVCTAVDGRTSCLAAVPISFFFAHPARNPDGFPIYTKKGYPMFPRTNTYAATRRTLQSTRVQAALKTALFP